MKRLLPFVLISTSAMAQAPRSLNGALPPSGANQVVAIEAGKRTLYLTREGELWLYEHSSASQTRMAPGRVWDATVSATGNLLAYVKGGEDRTDHSIYVVPLDPSTGKAAGGERRLSSTQGDAPAISPDGSLIAFARDDSTGAGQSLLMVPVAGGKERVIAGGMPSSIRSIAWTPDGKWIYFGVNAPVPCFPEWSCLPLGEGQRRWASIRRVPARGGAVTTVVSAAQSPFPALSPDGSTIVYRAMDGSRKWIVAEPDGAIRKAIELSQSQGVQGWTGNAALLLGEGSFGRGLRSVSILDLAKPR